MFFGTIIFTSKHGYSFLCSSRENSLSVNCYALLQPLLCARGYEQNNPRVRTVQIGSRKSLNRALDARAASLQCPKIDGEYTDRSDYAFDSA